MDYNSALMGANFRPQEAKNLVLNLTIGEVLTLQRDPHNEFDANAIQVHTGGEFIGFIERGLAEELAPLIDSGTEFIVTVEGFLNPLKPYLLLKQVVEA